MNIAATRAMILTLFPQWTVGTIRAYVLADAARTKSFFTPREFSEIWKATNPPPQDDGLKDVKLGTGTSKRRELARMRVESARKWYDGKVPTTESWTQLLTQLSSVR